MNTLPRHAMHRLLLFLIAVAVGLLFAPSAFAQPALDLSRLDEYFDDEPTVEVNLTGSLLRLAAAATAEEEPEAAALVEGLDAVTVRIYPLSSALTDLADNLSDLGREFEAEGWQTLVRVRPDPTDAEERDDVWIYVREEGDAFGGLVVMTLDEAENEAAFVVIDGLIDPAEVGRLTRFGGFGLDAGEDADANEAEDEN